MQTVGSAKRISLAGASVVLHDSNAHKTARFAEMELRRYLYLLTELNGASSAREGTTVVLSTDPNSALELGLDQDALGGEGYAIRTSSRQSGAVVVNVIARNPVALLYGVYALVEEMGVGFWLGGDSFPDRDDPAAGTIPQNWNVTHRPVFAIRGHMLHYNFLVGCTTWGLSDYQFFFDQVARARCNLLLIHWYDAEPGAASLDRGEYVSGGAATSSVIPNWGALAPLKTSDYSFGTGEFFDEEIFASPMAETARDVIEEIHESERVFAQATSYAKDRGVRVAAGFEAPRGCPTDDLVRRRFIERVEQFLNRNPDADYFALWNHESGGCVGTPAPAAGSASDELYQRHREHFAYLGAPERIWEAIRFGRFAQIAHEVMRRISPEKKFVVVGWGGDRWMLFADFCIGYDTFLPRDVVFTCHDNIDASLAPSVSAAWGQLPPERERWAMPWAESDLSDCWTKQPIVEQLGTLAPDALAKGCQGFLLLSWRVRDIEEEAGFMARFAWDSTLTPARFYEFFAEKTVGLAHRGEMADVVGRLQKLGARWTGVSGVPECGLMKWTGWDPPIPARLDDACVQLLMQKAEKAMHALAEVVKTKDDQNDAAFHLRPDASKEVVSSFDATRPGVIDFQKAHQRLAAVVGAAPHVIRAELARIDEMLQLVRPTLIHGGMRPACYRPVDEFLIYCHHLARHGEVASNWRELESLSARIGRLLDALASDEGARGIERLHFIHRTIAFALKYDAVSLMLAPGGRVQFAILEAEARAARGEKGAGLSAEEAYCDLVAGGFHEAIEALTHRLTVRGDWGVLATVNGKAALLYWKEIGRLEAMISVPPPRSVSARYDGVRVCLQWPASPKPCAGYRVYRQHAEEKWRLVRDEMLASGSRLFVDENPGAGEMKYAVAAIDQDGREGPRSHPRTVWVGSGVAPRIVSPLPPSSARAGAPLVVRAVVSSDLKIASVSIRHRRTTDDNWTSSPMRRRFRASFEGSIPGEILTPGVWVWYVEAVDIHGARTTWPHAAESELPFSISVV